MPVSNSTFDHRPNKDVEMTDSQSKDHSIDKSKRLY
jgi:hypothetical protein